MIFFYLHIIIIFSFFHELVLNIFKHLCTCIQNEPTHLYKLFEYIDIYILYIYSDTTPHIRNAAIAQRHLSPLCAHLQRDQYCLFGLWSSGTVSLKTTKHNHPVTRYFRHSLLSIAVRLSTYRKLITIRRFLVKLFDFNLGICIKKTIQQ